MRSFLRNRRFKNFAFKTDVLCSCLLLNSKKIPFTDADKKSLENIFVEAQKDVSFWGVQNSSDNPRKNIMTVCLNYKAATDWGMQYLFSASLIYYREKRNGTFSDWVQIK